VSRVEVRTRIKAVNGGRVSVKKKEKSKANNSFMLVTVQLFNRMMLSVS
jgi:hypothetical protein